MIRRRFTFHGAVQGVGFRPFIHALARELDLAGWVRNDPAGVVCEVEGAGVEDFAERLRRNLPPPARIEHLAVLDLPPSGVPGFRILPSRPGETPTATILPDLATCTDCLREIRDPADRRHRHPFVNCTHCGPRFSIVERIPYDRANTSMGAFKMCADCEREYHDPDDRRFHAQPNACPRCGPQLWIVDAAGRRHAEADDALSAAADALRRGQVVAVKGIGGFHLMVDARNEPAIRRLRKRKQRGDKPFAVMFPSLTEVLSHCHVSPRERELLESAAAPIVLLRRQRAAGLPDAIAPGIPQIGALLPYSGLHHLLLSDVEAPLIATSGNLSDEPIGFTNAEALHDLAPIADLFLMHDRDIVRPVDDSIVRVMAGREMILRRSRGYVPQAIALPVARNGILAAGADLKNTIAWTHHQQAFLSQHLGDLGTERSLDAHAAMLRDLPSLYPGNVQVHARDPHPGYHSSRGSTAAETVEVQHHHAHIIACQTEHGLSGECLGVAFDGTGYGPDGTIWGGEFLLVDGASFKRVNRLRPFPLPGGEKAVRDPRHSALGLLHEADLLDPNLPFLDLSTTERSGAQAMLRTGFNCPRTSSMGRLFDAVSALLGLCRFNHFEGEAAMRLESACERPGPVRYPVSPGPPVDWRPMLEALLADRHTGTPAGVIASRFHLWVVDLIAWVAGALGQKTVVMSGGCFQNSVVLESAVQRLKAEGFEVYWPHRVPPNDGGIALGQAAVAACVKPFSDRPETD